MAWHGLALLAGWLVGRLMVSLHFVFFSLEVIFWRRSAREGSMHLSFIHAAHSNDWVGAIATTPNGFLQFLFFFPFPLPRLLPPPYYSATFTDVHHGVNRFVYFYVLFYSVLFSFCCCLPCTSRTDGHATMGWETMGGYNIGCITTIHNDGSRRTSLEIMGNNRTAVGYNRAPTLIRWRLAPRCLRQKSSEKAHRWLIKVASIVCR